MIDEERAELRKHIQVAIHFGTSDSRVWLNKVFALIDAKDTPSVPMAMLLEVSSLVESATMQDRLAYCRSIAARYGYATKEET